MSLTPAQQQEILGRIRATDMRMVQQQQRMAEAEARIRATDLRMVQQQERMAEAMDRLASIEAAITAE